MEGSILEHFWQETERNPEYAMVIPLSVTLHRFEKDHQDYSKPRIFIKTLDRDGFTIRMRMNEMYLSSLEKAEEAIIEDLNQNAIKRIDESLDWLEDDSLRAKVEAMVMVDGCEEDIYNALREMNPDRVKYIDQMAPIIERVGYDERGIPLGYRLNSHITECSTENGDPVISIGGMPISQEDIESLNIDKLLKNFNLPSEE